MKEKITIIFGILDRENWWMVILVIEIGKIGEEEDLGKKYFGLLGVRFWDVSYVFKRRVLGESLRFEFGVWDVYGVE